MLDPDPKHWWNVLILIRNRIWQKVANLSGGSGQLPYSSALSLRCLRRAACGAWARWCASTGRRRQSPSSPGWWWRSTYSPTSAPSSPASSSPTSSSSSSAWFPASRGTVQKSLYLSSGSLHFSLRESIRSSLLCSDLDRVKVGSMHPNPDKARMAHKNQYRYLI